jgi:molybdopterin-guanine dinucleotide biosynthesis protein A
MENPKNILAFILAVGNNIRFKQDIILFPYKRKPLIEYAIDTVKIFGISISIITNNSELFNYLRIACYQDRSAADSKFLHESVCSEN